MADNELIITITELDNGFLVEDSYFCRARFFKTMDLAKRRVDAIIRWWRRDREDDC
jgi:hypothetical protein